MNEIAWISIAVASNLPIMKPLITDPVIQDAKERRDFYMKNGDGEVLPIDKFPKVFWGEDSPEGRRFIKKLPSFFWASGLWFCSAECAGVLEQFDLGKGQLFPVELYQHDRKTLIEGAYFGINFGSVKEVALREQSPGIELSCADSSQFFPNILAKDDETFLTPSALEGADWWIDSGVFDSLFLSDRLKKALQKKKLTKPFNLKRCQITTKS